MITYRDADWAPREARIEALTGVIAPTSEQPLARTRTFAQPLLGHLRRGDGRDGRRRATAGTSAGDRAGRSGLQAQYDADAGRCTRHPRHGERRRRRDPVREGAHRRRRRRDHARPDRAGGRREGARRRRARRAGGGRRRRRARAGRCWRWPTAPTTGFDRALTGHYPPGSTFKVATSYAYLTRGITTPGGDGALPRVGHGRRSRVHQLRRRVDQRQPDLLPGLHRLVQHGVRRAVRRARRRRPHDRREGARHRRRLGRHARRRRAPSTAACRPRPAARTPRPRRSARAGSRCRRCRSR